MNILKFAVSVNPFRRNGQHHQKIPTAGASLDAVIK
jgi:hypothetical protein